MDALLVLVGAVLLDVLLGEYPAPLHPVVWIGAFISNALRLAPSAGWRRQFAFGSLLAITTIGVSVGLCVLALGLARSLPWLEIVLGVFFLKSALALRALGQAAFRVVGPLEAGDLDAARVALRSLCSRDPNALGPEELLAATVQSLAENSADSFVAPLFYFVLLGVPGAVGYRAINTLDAMVGYRGRLEWLGKFSARLDDIASWVPARLTAALFLLAGAGLGKNAGAGWRIARRDAGRTPSPNGGWPMAVMAGLLEVRLDKPGGYTLGDPVQSLTAAKVREAWRVVVVASMTMAALGAGALTWMAR